MYVDFTDECLCEVCVERRERYARQDAEMHAAAAEKRAATEETDVEFDLDDCPF